MQTGEEVFDRKTIALKYIRTRFIIDVLATLPLDLIIDGGQDD